MNTTMIALCLLAGINIANGDMGATEGRYIKPHETEEVLIAGNALRMSPGRIVLVRYNLQYCAVKFTETWTGKTEHDKFANYASFYQGDGSGDFLRNNVQLIKERLAERRLIGLGKMFSFPAGPQNLEIKCGPIRLFWSSAGTIYFRGHAKEEMDYGIELAPTKWTSIPDVNVFDPRLKWYRFDGRRKETHIPIDQLWEDKEDRK